MVTVEIPEQQVVSMVEQLSSAAEHEILKRLILDYDDWNAIVDAGDERITPRSAPTRSGLG